MMLYECDVHYQRFLEGVVKGCATCTRIVQLMDKNKEVSARLALEPKRVVMREEVYWPSDNSHEGRLITNLEHKPQFFSEKRKFRDYLKKNNIREAS